MSNYSTLMQRSLVASLLAVLLVGLGSRSFGNRCQPPTPSPCGADGVCRPIRPTWGHSVTRWRPWPGETVGQPTPAEPEAGAKTGEQDLGPYDLPNPEQEDLRGPAKDSKKKVDREQGDAEPVLPEADGEAPFEVPPMQLPGDDAEQVPAFDPQGNRLNVPARGVPALNVMPTDDAPPALPVSLRQAAHAMNMPVAAQRNSSQPLSLVNPASAIVAPHTVDAPQHAIYYEASDQ